MPNEEQLHVRYQVGKKIGQFIVLQDPLVGGMGEVYKCKDEISGGLGLVAVKTLRYDRRRSPRIHELFKQEAVRWLELGRQRNLVHFISAFHADGRLCLISEWIEPDERGRTSLGDWLCEGPLNLRQALDFTMDICLGLLHAQAKVPGIVHRDLKPSNILVGWTSFFRGLSRDPATIMRSMPEAQSVCEQVAKINDWGLLKVVKEAEEGSVWPRESEKGGTRLYMAPEQWHGWRSDARTDLYAVGCILFEMLVGRPPYVASTVDALMACHLNDPVPRLPPTIPQRDVLQHIIGECMAKHPDDRYPDAVPLLDQLAHLYHTAFGTKPRAFEPDVVTFSAEYYFNRGCSYFSLEEYDKALECFEEAKDTDSEFSHGHFGHGLVHLQRARYTDALAAFLAGEV